MGSQAVSEAGFWLTLIDFYGTLILRTPARAQMRCHSSVTHFQLSVVELKGCRSIGT